MMLKNFLTAIVDLLFPKICFYCKNLVYEYEYLCNFCFQKIKFLYPPLCKLCSRPLAKNNIDLCNRCKKSNRNYDGLISVALYEEPLVKLFYLFKYSHYDYLGEFFSKIMILHLEKIGVDFKNYDFVTTVPLHIKKIQEREYNQSEILAKFMSKHFKIPFRNDIIYEIRPKPSQTKLDPKKRKDNVKDAFSVKENLENKKIVLIDDVFTTGATVDECARALKAKRAKTVFAVTFLKA